MGTETESPQEGWVGLFYRHQYTRNGNVVDLDTPVYSDICQQNRLIINGVPISFKFWPHRNEFSIISIDDKKYKFDITEAVMKACFVKIHPNTILAHDRVLMDHPISHFIPYIVQKLNVLTLPRGSTLLLRTTFFILCPRYYTYVWFCQVLITVVSIPTRLILHISIVILPHFM